MVASIRVGLLAAALLITALPPTAAQSLCKDDAQVIEIPDPGLSAAVMEALQKVPPERVTCQDARSRKLTQLDARRQMIISLQGLEYFADLQSLILADNAIRDLTPLERLTNLTNVRLENNLIEDLAPLLANAKASSGRRAIVFDVTGNCLDLSDGSKDAKDRDALSPLRVSVRAGAQRRDCPQR